MQLVATTHQMTPDRTLVSTDACSMPTDFETLPPEILLRILSFLAIDDLHSLTRTSHLLRQLSCDPILHVQRLHLASQTLSVSLVHRPSIDTIRPPRALIYLSRTLVLARAVSRSLISVRLNHKLSRRLPADSLVDRAILPRECTSYSSLVAPALIQSRQAVSRERLRLGLGRKLKRRPSLASLVSLNILPAECATRAISPGLVATRRKVIRERLKDGLRAWVEGRAVLAQERKADEVDAQEKTTVKGLVRRYTARRNVALAQAPVTLDVVALEKKTAQAKWGREAGLARKREREREEKGRVDGLSSQPTRAKVLGLKSFWEGVIRTAAG